MEFYEVILQHYSEKGNKDKVAKFKKEMGLAFGISVGDLRFGKDNRGFVAVPEQKSINESMLSVKFLSQKCAEDLYTLGKEQNDSFIDLLAKIKEDTTINSRQLSILIKLNYFSDYAKNQKLLDFVEIFNTFHGAKSIKKSKYENNEQMFSLIEMYSTSTDKTFKNIDYTEILKNIWNQIEDGKIKLSEQASHEAEYLGYIQLKEPKISKDYYVISKMAFGRNEHKPFLELYNIKTGEITYSRIKDDELFQDRSFKLHDVIKVLSLKPEPKIRRIDGKYVPTSEKEMVLKNYFVV